MPSPAGRVIQVFQPTVGGVPLYVSALSRGLAHRGWHVVVAAPEDSVGLDEVRRAGIETIPLQVSRNPQLVQDRSAVRRLVAAARHHGIDLVHGHSSKAGGLAALAGRTAGIASVYTPHAWAFQMRNPLLIRATLAGSEAALVRLHKTVMTVCDDEAEAARRWGVANPERVRVVHTGLEPQPDAPPDPTATRRFLGLPEDRPVIAWLGRAGRQKQPGELAAIAPEVDATIVALGHGLAEDAALSQELGDAGVRVAPEETPASALLAAADAFLMTSAWEGFPLAVLEAMRAGLPVVAYDVGGLAEQVRNGVTGFLVDLGDRRGLAASLRSLVADPVVCAEMGRASRRRFAERFTLDRMLDGVEDVYATAAVTNPRLTARSPTAS